MKIFTRDRKTGRHLVGEVPDGAICLEHGARETNPDGSRTGQIVEIDKEAMTFRREGCEREPITDMVYCYDDVDWRPA